MKLTLEFDSNDVKTIIEAHAFLGSLIRIDPDDLPDRGADPYVLKPDRGADDEPPLPTVDSEGMSWNNRIHSTPAKINADGKFRRRKGISEIDYARIVAELRPVASPFNGDVEDPDPVTIGFGVDTPPPPPGFGVDIPPPPPGFGVDIPPPPPALPVPTPPAEEPVPHKSFIDTMLYVSDLLLTKKLTNADVEGFAHSVGAAVNGVGKVARLMDLPHLIPEFLKLIEGKLNEK